MRQPPARGCDVARLGQGELVADSGLRRKVAFQRLQTVRNARGDGQDRLAVRRVLQVAVRQHRRQVALVQHDAARPPVQRAQERFVLIRQRTAHVQHQQHHVRIRQGAARAVNANAFHRVVRVVQASSVRQVDDAAGEHQRALHQIARRAGNRGHNRPFPRPAAR